MMMHTTECSSSLQRKSFAKRHPVASYFLLTYLISWTGALLIASPWLMAASLVATFFGNSLTRKSA